MRAAEHDGTFELSGDDMKTILTILCAALLCTGAFIAVAQDAPANVAGEWTFSLTFVAGQAEHSAVITQENGKLTGAYKGSRLEGPLSGRVEGDTVDFTGRLRNESTGVAFHYKGKIAGDTMTGTVEMGEYWTAEFTGKKKK